MIEWAIFNKEFSNNKLWNVQRTIKSAKDNFFSLFTSGFWSTLGEADFLNSMNNLQPKWCKHTFNDPWFNVIIELIQEPWNLFMELRLILRTPDQILPTRHSSKYHCFGLRQIQRYLLQFSTTKSKHTLIPSSRPLMICSLFLTCAFSSLILVDVISPHLKWLFLLWSQTFGHPNLIETHHHPIEYMTFMFVFKGHHKYGLNLSHYCDQTFDIAL